MTQIRSINIDIIASAIKDMIFEASFTLSKEVIDKFDAMMKKETNPLALETLRVLKKNAEIAKLERLPLCQDCGSTIVFAEIGQHTILDGGDFETAIENAVAAAYSEFYLRKSIVGDPLKRANTGTNTPASIHTRIVPGNGLKLSVYLKGGGSENMSTLRMFRPTDTIDSIIAFIEDRVIEAGPNPCPPLFLGIGIGGTADIALLNSKEALLRGIDSRHPDPFYAELEDKIATRLNGTGVGVLGFGGNSTVAGVYIKEAPAHIASLPVALNMNCHSFRMRTREL